MNKFTEYFKKLFSPEATRDVALVLGGGGARGYAHIGAIEVLEEHGYNITSISGTSMGALVGGVYAAGKLPEFKEKILDMKRKHIVSLMNISIGLDHIATGKRLMSLINTLTGGLQIEDLRIPFCCCATDIVTGKEKVFCNGPLSMAIRASISIPGVLSPVHEEGHIYVDGSIHNTLPLDRVSRNGHDLLVAINASAPDTMPLSTYSAIKKKENEKSRYRIFRKFPDIKSQLSENYMSLAVRTTNIAIQNNTQMAIRLTPPDLCVDVPMDKFDLFDFDKGRVIVEYGRKAMEQKLRESRMA